MDDLFEMALAENGKGILFTKASLIHGYGLFTDRDLPVQTILCRRLGLRCNLSLRDKRAIIGINGLDPGNPENNIFKNINRSCHPNARLSDTGCLINIENLADGTEITVDYSPLLLGTDWEAPCLCGSADCRHIIKSILKLHDKL